MTTTLSTSYTRRGEFWNGIKDTFPMILGATPFGIIFGALGVTGGLSPEATLGMSLFVFAGSAQFIAAGLVTQGVGMMFIILTTFVVNLRHMLYAASLGPYVRDLPQKWLVPLGFMLTDEAYAITIRRYQFSDDHSPYKHWYFLGSALYMYVNWQICTLIGIVAGTQLEGMAEWGLDFAMVVTFIGIVVPLIISRPMLICALSAGITALLTNGMPNKFGLIVAAVVGIAAGLTAEMIQKEKPKRKNEPMPDVALNGEGD